MLDLKDIERAEIERAIGEFKRGGGRIIELASQLDAKPGARRRNTAKKTQKEIDVALKRRFQSALYRLRVGMQVWHRDEIAGQQLGITASAVRMYASAGTDKVPPERLVKRLADLAASGKEYNLEIKPR